LDSVPVVVGGNEAILDGVADDIAPDRGKEPLDSESRMRWSMKPVNAWFGRLDSKDSNFSPGARDRILPPMKVEASLGSVRPLLP